MMRVFLRRAAQHCGRQRQQSTKPPAWRRLSVAPQLAVLEDDFLEQQTYYQPTATEAIQHQVEVLDEEEQELQRYNELYRRQIETEEECLEKASADYAAMVDELMALGKGAELKPVQALVASWYEPSSTSLWKERNNALAGAGAIWSRTAPAVTPEQWLSDDASCARTGRNMENPARSTRLW